MCVEAMAHLETEVLATRSPGGKCLLGGLVDVA